MVGRKPPKKKRTPNQTQKKKNKKQTTKNIKIKKTPQGVAEKNANPRP